MARGMEQWLGRHQKDFKFTTQPIIWQEEKPRPLTVKRSILVQKSYYRRSRFPTMHMPISIIGRGQYHQSKFSKPQQALHIVLLLP